MTSRCRSEALTTPHSWTTSAPPAPPSPDGPPPQPPESDAAGVEDEGGASGDGLDVEVDEPLVRLLDEEELVVARGAGCPSSQTASAGSLKSRWSICGRGRCTCTRSFLPEEPAWRASTSGAVGSLHFSTSPPAGE